MRPRRLGKQRCLLCNDVVDGTMRNMAAHVTDRHIGVIRSAFISVSCRKVSTGYEATVYGMYGKVIQTTRQLRDSRWVADDNPYGEIGFNQRPGGYEKPLRSYVHEGDLIIDYLGRTADWHEEQDLYTQWLIEHPYEPETPSMRPFPRP